MIRKTIVGFYGQFYLLFRHRCSKLPYCNKCHRIAIKDALIYDRNQKVYCNSKGAQVITIKQTSKITNERASENSQSTSKNKQKRQSWVEPGPIKCEGCNMEIFTGKII